MSAPEGVMEKANLFERENQDHTTRTRTLWSHAVLANQLVKLCRDNPKIQHKVRGHYLSELSRLGCVHICNAKAVAGGILLRFGSDYGELHAFDHELDADVRAHIAPMLSNFLKQKQEGL
jgi:hypothetical protein